MRRVALVVLAALLAVACGDDTAAPDDTTTTTTEASAEATTDGSEGPDDPSEDEGSRYEADVAALADEAMEGRAAGTPGSEVAQEYLVEALREFAEPLGDDFRHPFDIGTNLIGVIPGDDLAEEHLILGAHYDHLGMSCERDGDRQAMCPGATDNAAGVAAVLEIGRRIAEGEAPRRSVVIALWDAEEVGLVGSNAYVNDPLVPLESTVAYLNWDIQGANLLPSLRDVTVMVGTETGGEVLASVAGDVAAESELDFLDLSLLFGQGRSDHAPFAAAGVPIVFFSDTTSACYHTAYDDASIVDFDKLGAQIDNGERLARALADTEERPTHDGDAPLASYEDAETMLDVVSRGEPEFDRFPEDSQESARQFLGELEAMVEAGPDAFDDAAIGTLLSGSAMVVELLTVGECDGYLE